ncbi:hypothetical protein EST38_g13162 [Candolleomyces aberdarensis]|uniref:Fungal-type protein kinase domain-containing protein n=1 Tax=Candolleomyces aberdarensis TaxID=2316362 RepID=A0A4Q2D2X6_9AGAR|nr:hypothetical protein EST38_g13162 [Candolleomyces aberdarensis]
MDSDALDEATVEAQLLVPGDSVENSPVGRAETSLGLPITSIQQAAAPPTIGTVANVDSIALNPPVTPSQRPLSSATRHVAFISPMSPGPITPLQPIVDVFLDNPSGSHAVEGTTGPGDIGGTSPITPEIQAVRDACSATIQTFSETQDSSTPYRPTTHAADGTENAADMATLVLKELDEVVVTDDKWVKQLYRGLVSSTDIRKFLRTSGKFKNNRWVGIPEAIELERQLYAPICEIVNSILENVAPAGIARVRKAVDTHSVHFMHETLAPTSTSRFTSPDIVIKASGPSFSIPPGRALGYGNSASFFDGKREAEADKLPDHLGQLGKYARQIFIQQPNRRFVRCLIITEQHVRLFHFDRSGAQYTPYFNYHDHPHVFVRLILGLSSIDERVLGLDDSVQWTIGPAGVKTGGTLSTIGPDNSTVKYQLIMDSKPFIRHSIRGRGTTCWPVRDSMGNQLLVKDYWMSEGRVPEFEMLKLATGVPGVGQMVSYEDRRAETRDYRGNVSVFGANIFNNRIAIRIVLKAYGASIDKFTSAKQLFSAFRDAIAAHQKLVGKGLIHRDICLSNILLGLAGADPGYRGILIDLDMSIGPERPITSTCKEFRTGSPMFYSLTILMALQLEKKLFPAHDYLDDLESLFYIFCYLVFMYTANGQLTTKNAVQKLFISTWADVHGPESSAWSTKHSFLTVGMVIPHASASMDESWRLAGGWDLFVKFRRYIAGLVSERISETRLPAKNEPDANGNITNRFSAILSDINIQYAHILGLFDAALKRAEEAEALEPLSNHLPLSAPEPDPPEFSDTEPQARPSTMPPPQVPSPPPLHHTRSNRDKLRFTDPEPPKVRSKRRSEDVLLDEPRAESSGPKRSRKQSSGPSALSQSSTPMIVEED